MDNYSSIGSAVRYLRKKENLSQEQLANQLFMSKTVISKIESNKRRATHEQLLLLSNFFRFDLLTFETKVHNYKTLEHYFLANELINCIRNARPQEILNITKDNPTFNEFNYGEPLVLRIYCNALIQIHINNDIDIALKTCLDFFNISLSNVHSFTPKINEPNQYYSLILTLTHCLSLNNKYTEVIAIYEITIDFIEKIYLNENLPFLNVDNFIRKFYIICLNNFADIYFNLQNFEAFLTYCNKGIDYSNKLNVLSVLPQLTKIKTEIFYVLNYIEDTKETYQEFKYICRLTNNTTYFEDSTESFMNKYPKFFS